MLWYKADDFDLQLNLALESYNQGNQYCNGMYSWNDCFVGFLSNSRYVVINWFHDCVVDIIDTKSYRKIKSFTFPLPVICDTRAASAYLTKLSDSSDILVGTCSDAYARYPTTLSLISIENLDATPKTDKFHLTQSRSYKPISLVGAVVHPEKSLIALLGNSACQFDKLQLQRIIVSATDRSRTLFDNDPFPCWEPQWTRPYLAPKLLLDDGQKILLYRDKMIFRIDYDQLFSVLPTLKEKRLKINRVAGPCVTLSKKYLFCTSDDLDEHGNLLVYSLPEGRKTKCQLVNKAELPKLMPKEVAQQFQPGFVGLMDKTEYNSCAPLVYKGRDCVAVGFVNGFLAVFSVPQLELLWLESSEFKKSVKQRRSNGQLTTIKGKEPWKLISSPCGTKLGIVWGSSGGTYLTLDLRVVPSSEKPASKT